MADEREAKVVVRDTNGVTGQTRESDTTKDEPKHNIKVVPLLSPL